MKKQKKHPKECKLDERLHLGRKKDGVIFPVASITTAMPSSYVSLLSGLKERIRRERSRIVFAGNTAMILLYWDVGSNILIKQKEEGWGAKVIDRLSVDLGKEFPELKGFSPRNLKYMRAFAAAWPDKVIVQQVVAQLPWKSNIALLDKLDSVEERLWYAKKTLQHGWSHNILAIQMSTRLYQRAGKAVNNFSLALPPFDSDMAKQIFKDP